MLLRNRAYIRNSILYAIVLMTWIALFAFPLLFFQVRRIPFIALEILLLSALMIYTLMHFLRMPLSLKIEKDGLVLHLPHKRIEIDPEEILDINYDRRNCRLRIISIGSSYSFGDLRISEEEGNILVSLPKDGRRRRKGRRFPTSRIPEKL